MDIKITVYPAGSAESPLVSVYNVSIENTDGILWDENFVTLGEVNAFLSGVKVNQMGNGDFTFMPILTDQFVRNRLFAGEPFQLWPDKELEEI